ncbi:MAG TPA: hypothetical protein VLV88_00865 [Terriglobales bacterium]|nr:hypothetical protein [Terriglobales bacterium]
MEPLDYIILDVLEGKSSDCGKDSSGQRHAEGTIAATRFDLDRRMKTLRRP